MTPGAAAGTDLRRLLSGVAAGDEGAWRRFLELFGPALYGFAWRALRPDGDHLDDVVQECLLRLLRRSLRASGPGEVVRYLERTVASVVTDLARQRTAGKRTGGAVGFPRCDPPDQEEMLLQREGYLRLLRRVGATGVDHRRNARIVHLLVVEGRSSREIAAAVGLSPSGVDSQLYRLRRQVQR